MYNIIFSPPIHLANKSQGFHWKNVLWNGARGETKPWKGVFVAERTQFQNLNSRGRPIGIRGRLTNDQWAIRWSALSARLPLENYQCPKCVPIVKAIFTQIGNNKTTSKGSSKFSILKTELTPVRVVRRWKKFTENQRKTKGFIFFTNTDKWGQYTTGSRKGAPHSDSIYHLSLGMVQSKNPTPYRDDKGRHASRPTAGGTFQHHLTS